MTDAASVPAQVARFALRGRASSEAFADGVRLAAIRAVAFGEVTQDRVSAIVRDPAPHSVALIAGDNSLVGDCDCPDGAGTVCRHQVAAAHTIWCMGREHGRDGDGSETVNPGVWSGDCGVLLREVRACPDASTEVMVCSCGAEVLPQQERRDS